MQCETAEMKSKANIIEDKSVVKTQVRAGN